MKILKQNPKNWGYTHETDEFIIDYFDIFFCSYDSRVVKAEKTVKSKITKQKTYWRAWFDLPEDLAKDLKVHKLSGNWPPKDPELDARFDAWLEEKLLSDNEWMNDSINEYDSEKHTLPMVSFALLENIHQAISHNSGLPEQIREFLDEAKKVLKKGEHQFEYLGVYSEIVKDDEGNESKEFIVENDDPIRLSNISKIQLFNRLSRQGWLLDFQDKDGHYIFKRSFEITMPTVLGNQTQEFYYESSLNLELSQLHLHKKTTKYLNELGISIVGDLLDTVNSIDELQQNLASIAQKYENEDENNNKIFFVDNVTIDIEKLKRIFQEDKGISLQEAVFSGFLVPIEMLQLSARGYSVLKRGQVDIVADLMEYSFKDLLEFKNMTRKEAINIRESLEKNLGLSLKMD